MQNDKASRSESNSDCTPFTTIDDLTEKAKELAEGLRELGERKHPLAVRKAGKGVSEIMDKEKESRQLKGAGRTYFLDVEQTRGGKSYLRITESRKGEGDKFERSSINVFPEDAEEFATAVSEMTEKLG